MSKHAEQDFAYARAGGMRQGRKTFSQGIDLINQRCNRYPSTFEGLQGWGKAATT